MRWDRKGSEIGRIGQYSVLKLQHFRGNFDIIYKKCLVHILLISKPMEFAQQEYQGVSQINQMLSPDQDSVMSGNKQTCKTAENESNMDASLPPCIGKNKKIKKGDRKLLNENCQKYVTVLSNRKRTQLGYIQYDVEMNEHSRRPKGNKKKSNRVPRVNKKSSTTCDTGLPGDRPSLQNVCSIQSTTFENEMIENVSFKGLRLQQNIAVGGIGYSTLMFKNKIIEGSYYLEFNILQPLTDLDCKYKPDIRLGLCGADHKLDVPIGYAKSIGFSLNKKQIIQQGVKRSLTNLDCGGPEIIPGDTLGMLLQFSPPFRLPDNQKVWDDSCLTFFHNGRAIGKYQELKQMFYHPAVSLYNGSRVQVKIKAEDMKYLPNYSQPFEKISQFVNNYK